MKQIPFPFALNIGTDIVHIPRIQRLVARSVAASTSLDPAAATNQKTSLSRFVRRILCEQEQAYFKSKFRLSSIASDVQLPPQPITAQTSTEIARWLAGRFAAKEAARKAAPGGASSVSWKEVMIRAEAGGDGRPEVVYFREGGSVGQLGKLSISHDGEYVVATVIAATPELQGERTSNLKMSRLLRSFNEQLRLAECHVQFNQGGFNRVLQATFKDGYTVLARIPYHSMVPKRFAVASEAATLGLLHSRGLPVPRVLGYSASNSNSVGVEYLLLEKIDGSPLGDRWFTIGNKTRAEIMKQIVAVETRFMSITFPASGSLYYRKDLTSSEPNVLLPEQTTADDIAVGPIAQYEWWYKERASLNVDRGPWETFLKCFEAPAKREISFCKEFGKPRLHVERYLRELHKLQKMTPTAHVQVLSQYLQLAPHLEIPAEHPFARPVLRHPDFSPNNILVNSDNEIVGVIDWQHAAVLPLGLCANIPSYFQNWGDPVSERLATPMVKRPENFDTLSEAEQESIKETMRKQIAHFYYAALTMKQLPDHFDALRNYNSMLRAKLFTLAGAPWEGDTLSLKHAIIEAYQKWPIPLEKSSYPNVVNCPVQFTREEILKCVTDFAQEQEKLQEFTEMKACANVDSVGWVPDDEHLEKSRDIARIIKAGLLEHSTTELEREAIRNHFPFDDHDEDL
ncbi:hypothetical protein A7D00_2911 [Trichophyton violaceum]|uniref:Phosphotransferase enzyme family protein n=1 Tax=Trichophyton violaceum TaxID=34388 RepID=A0A178FLZ1_TRIVO|nr:hypothetical protein A7D00_2911 [Trichophyton violaceum]